MLFVVGGVLVVAGLWASPGWSQEPKRQPVIPPGAFGGKALPTPPSQTEKWTPPESKLPQSLITATQFLFEHGFADPRGCEYREITVVTGGVSGGHIATQTHGWILPEAASPNGRFAVCWNGLVYPLVEVGPPTDLRADFAQPSEVGWLGHAIPEASAVSHRATWPRVCLLLRLGEIELAGKLWKTPAATESRGTASADDPFLVLSNDWLWMSFDRAVCAHMRGDHWLALATAEPLARHRDAFEREAERRGFVKPDGAGSNDRGKKPYFDFLRPLDRLLAEQQRRTKLEPVERVLSAKADPFANREDRIAALVRDLEEVEARQSGQPGGVSPADDPIVAALAGEGTPAIEPLLLCLEKDQRLTRSVSFHRDFFTHRELIGVDAAAYAALCLILETRTFGPRTEHGYAGGAVEQRRAVADEIRQYWEERRNVPIAERWFVTLQDDHATSSQWLEAAGRLTMAADVRIEGAWLVTPARQDGKVPKMRGESLRERKEPSVAELMAKRSDQVAATKDSSSRVLYEMEKACQIARCLAKWDQKQALPTLQARVRDCVRMTTNKGGLQPYATQILGASLTNLTVAAVRAGDVELLPDYCRWLRETPPDELMRVSSFRTHELFAPLWMTPNNDVSRETAGALFNGKDSPWNPVHRAPPKGNPFQAERLASTPLLGVPAFREQLLRNLRNVDNAGTVSVKDGRVSLETPGRSGGTAISDRTDPHLPKTDARQDVRVCDLYGWHLSLVDGAPRFELYWPEDIRDQALARSREFLERWGPNFGTAAPRDEPPRRGRDFQMTYARFTLPPLKRPATDDDVKQGFAIFSLGTAGPVRQVPLGRMPQMARWITLKDFPITEPSAAPDTEPKVSYQQDGLIWQAEEIQQNGEWVRYYGFVGRHVIARVPAGEIELLSDPQPARP
jgi:hypothetical protein